TREVDLSVRCDWRSGESTPGATQTFLVNSFARLCVVSRQHALVVACVKQLTVNNGRRHVWTTALFAPRDEFVRLLPVLQRDVAIGAWLDCIDRLDGSVTARDKDQVLGHERRRCGDFRHRSQLPEFFSRQRVVTAYKFRSAGDQFSAELTFVNCRRAPRRDLLTRGFPDLFTGLEVERGNERILLDVGLNDNEVLVDDG